MFLSRAEPRRTRRLHTAERFLEFSEFLELKHHDRGVVPGAIQCRRARLHDVGFNSGNLENARNPRVFSASSAPPREPNGSSGASSPRAPASPPMKRALVLLCLAACARGAPTPRDVDWPVQYRSAKTQLERNLEREKAIAAQTAPGLSALEQANRLLGV